MNEGAGDRFVLCKIDELGDPGTRGFEIDVGGPEPLRVFVVRKGDTLACYRNRCPHTGAPLEWQPDQFLDLDHSFIQCAIHGALFRPENGYCLRGPCAGQSLEPIRLDLDQGRLTVSLPSTAARLNAG